MADASSRAASTYLYEHWFKGKTQLPYDPRIDQYNWNMIFLVQFLLYFVVHALVRKFAPTPGKIEDFKKRNKMRDYNFYYLQYTSLLHALIALAFVLHLLAELSNPSIILRTMMKINGSDRTTFFYKCNEYMFAIIFIIARVFLTPLFLIYMFEAPNVLYSIKIGIVFILYVQLFWAFRIIEMLFEQVHDGYKKHDRKVPFIVGAGYNVMKLIQYNKRVRTGVAFFNFLWIVVLPHWYYGYVTRTLKFNLTLW